jgi:hypothetical protein
MNFLENKLSKVVLSTVIAFSVFTILQGCGGSDEECCQEVEPPKLSEKVSEVHKVVEVPQVIYIDRNVTEIVYVDRNVTQIQYIDRNITVIEYVDRNVTVDVIKVRPIAKYNGLSDGAVLTGNTLTIDGVVSSDSDGNVSGYKWTLDSVEISTQQNPTIDLPTQEGSHMLCLEVTDNDSLTSNKTCKTFTIPHKNSNPTAVISGLNDIVVKTDCPVSLSGTTSVAPDGNINTYEWTVDDTIKYSGKDQKISFATLGIHKVCLNVIDSNSLSDEQCSNVNVQPHVAPTPVLTLKDSTNKVLNPNPSGDLLLRNGRYDISCAGSVDDCNNTEPMTCEWNAHSYIIDANGNKVDYITDCFNDAEHTGHGPKVAKDSWITLCGDTNRFKFVEIELKITDKFGKTSTRTDIFEVAP